MFRQTWTKAMILPCFTRLLCQPTPHTRAHIAIIALPLPPTEVVLVVVVAVAEVVVVAVEVEVVVVVEVEVVAVEVVVVVPGLLRRTQIHYSYNVWHEREACTNVRKKEKNDRY